MAPLTSHLVLDAAAVIDLQMHTTYSDGTWQPAELLDYLVGEQFGLVAVTDHDRVDSIATVQRLGAARGLLVLGAVEMSTSWRGGATDVLCYGVDPVAVRELLALGQSVIRRQHAINREVYEELLRKGYAFPREQAVLGETHGALQTHELGLLLQQHGYSTGPGSVGTIMVEAGFSFATNPIADVVAAAHRGGAVCLIAHPGRGGDFTLYDAALLDALRQDVPIDGFEVYYPAHTPEQTALYLAYAEAHGLLVSSGSDSHGPEKPPIKYRADLSHQLLERLGILVH